MKKQTKQIIVNEEKEPSQFQQLEFEIGCDVHTTLRKYCDSDVTTIVYNAIEAYRGDNYNNYCKELTKYILRNFKFENLKNIKEEDLANYIDSDEIKLNRTRLINLAVNFTVTYFNSNNKGFFEKIWDSLIIKPKRDPIYNILSVTFGLYKASDWIDMFYNLLNNIYLFRNEKIIIED